MTESLPPMPAVLYWVFDGDHTIFGPHPNPARDGERVVICELVGPPDEVADNAERIIRQTSWCAIHEWTVRCLSLGAHQLREEKAAQTRQIAELKRRLAGVPPELLPLLEQLLERIGFHFSPDHKTMRLLEELEEVIQQLKKVAR